MKIAVTSTGQTLDHDVEPRFGRCAYFLIINSESLDFEALENPNISLGGGAGPQSAKLMADRGVQTVLTGNCGTNAFQTFGAVGIQVMTGVSGTAREAVAQYRAEKLMHSSQPNVESHFGMGRRPGCGMGRGRGLGTGRWSDPVGEVAGQQPPAIPPKADKGISEVKESVGDLLKELEALKNKIASLAGD